MLNKNKAALTAFLLAAGLTVFGIMANGCTTLKEVIWPVTVKCLGAPAAQLYADVKAIVESDGLSEVFSEKSLDALENLARTWGPEAVVCVLKELIDAYTAPTGVTAPPDNLARARRIQDFFVEHDVNVQAP